MSIVIIAIGKIINNKYILLVSQIVLGIIIYFALNHKFIWENRKYIPILDKIIKK